MSKIFQPVLGSSGIIGGKEIICFFLLPETRTIFILNQAEQTLISTLLPEGILEYFELTRVEKAEKMLTIGAHSGAQM